VCGIAGYRYSGGVEPSVLHSMVNALYHRGPDSEGYYKTPVYSAGMRRLSINDLEGGEQPLFNEDKSVVLLYNGEIYNSPQLRRALEKRGHRFRTSSDGEVICHLYSEYGEDLFEKLDGMFAAALWVEKEQKLILARDIPGEKPLYYSKLSETELVFGSEIKSLLQFPGWDRSLNYQALWDFTTFLWVPEPETAYKSVMALPRGHILVVDAKGIHTRSYANKFNQEDIEFDDNSVIEETRRVVTESIESRLLSDVPIGCFLSGGLDSSIVSAVVAKSVPQFTTFTIGFENVDDPYHGGGADESKYAEEFARHLGAEHHNIRVTSDDFRQSLVDFCTHGDQPFSVSSGLGILAIAKAAHEAGIKVLLSGDGADECFGGYSWYFHLQNSIKANKISTHDEDGCISFQNFGVTLEERLAILNGYSPQKRAWAWHYYASEHEKSQLFSPEYFESVSSSLRFFSDFNPGNEWKAEDFIKQDRKFYFPYEMLRKVDRMTMAYSVEGRVPFAAPAVLAHADKLRYSHLVRGKDLKWVLRKAFSHILPQAIYSRPKHGFNVPIDHWLRGEWADMLETAFAHDSAMMKLGLIHRKSRDIALKMLSNPVRLNGHTIFSFVMLNMWLEEFYGNNC